MCMCMHGYGSSMAQRELTQEVHEEHLTANAKGITRSNRVSKYCMSSRPVKQ